MIFGYDVPLLLLTIILVCFAFYVSLWSLQVAFRRKNKLWILLSGPVMGGGVWILHYMAMQSMHMLITYDLPLIVTSFLISTVGCLSGFYFISLQPPGVFQYCTPALIFSVSISAMHYTGLRSVSGINFYPTPLLIAASIGIILLACLVMLWFIYAMLRMLQNSESYSNLHRLCATVTLSLGVSTMHFIGMHATTTMQMGNMQNMGNSFDPLKHHQEISTVDITTVVLIIILFLLAVYIWVANFKGHLYSEKLKHELMDKNEQLQQVALHDSLTHLPNRRYLQEFLESKFGIDNSPLYLMFIDLDGFKIVNDTFGHAIGDELLIKITETIQQATDNNHFLARIGGDEFIVVACDEREESALALAHKLRTYISGKYELASTSIDCISASIGIAVFPKHANNAATLIRKGDVAMYEVKRSGKNNVLFFDDERMALPVCQGA